MCNLYTTRKSRSEIASLFGVEAGDQGNAPGEVYPGLPGMVVAGGAVRQMTWGFPLVTAQMRDRALAAGKTARPKPVNNTRMDKLASGFWKLFAVDPANRCLIPVERFAEAEGEKGKTTRTWFSVEGEPLFACAGIWRDSHEWGPVYSMMMTSSNELVSPIHDRMPVIVARERWDEWRTADFDALSAFVEPFPAERMTIDRTEVRWAGRSND